jgi:hypothetical protein
MTPGGQASGLLAIGGTLQLADAAQVVYLDPRGHGAPKTAKLVGAICRDART